MPKSRLRKNRGKGKGAKAARKARRERNDAVRALRDAGGNPLFVELNRMLKSTVITKDGPRG